MFTLFLITAFALASVMAIAVLADSGLRWWSAFGIVRMRMKQGYMTAGQRPAIPGGGGSGFDRSPRAYPVNRQVSLRAA